ncbi:MAG: TonB C-terminal domain-containing protein [Campylobacterota bacterium]
MVQSSRDDRYFYISGLISLTLFSAVILLFTLVVLHKSSIDTFAMQEDNYISVSIDMDLVVPTLNEARPDPKPTPKQEIIPEPEPEPAVEEIESTPDPVNTDVSSLFDDVWTQSADTKVEKKEEKVDTKRLAAIEKRIKTKETKQSQKASDKIKTLELVKPSIEVVGASVSTAPEVNKYLAKIHALVKSKFYPPASSEGESAKVRVNIDANGNVTNYRVLVYSGVNIFNEEVDRLKSRLQRMTFPKNPDGKSISLEIILTVED